MQDCPPYHALSYAWRSNQSTRQTILEGVPFDIGANLSDALYALEERFKLSRRIAGSESYLWVDALCIDQANTEERNHQVRMMADIYSCAKVVIVWLELEFEYFLETLGPQIVHEDLARNSLEMFFKADYWHRAWTVQEFELAQDIIFAAGSSFVGIEYVSLVLRIDARVVLPSSLQYDRVIRRIRDRGTIRQLPLRELLVQFRDLECQDPRDTVFALLGLAQSEDTESGAPSIEPHFEWSPEELCVQLRARGVEAWQLSEVLWLAASRCARAQ